ncbi:coiled-coil domain-containing protein 12 [Diaphorina citri]|uniref:Coiled-coil domain-containing protein 12 n=1 Tax=Diaphorina citri TaxID=121845 RepID=A0A1S3D5I0_DIACI|nr:coiled-coil domain-containing protein 12 [Diaphorina citri]
MAQSNEDKIGKLEDEALKRKERLAQLKRKAKEDNKEKEQTEEGKKKPKFRSYLPLDEELKNTAVIPQAKPGDVESIVREELEAGKSTVVIDEVDLTKLAPRKPDWDLKRDLSKKLDKLHKRQQKAIAELIRERLKSGLTQTYDLATKVTLGANANRKLDVEEED